MTEYYQLEENGRGVASITFDSIFKEMIPLLKVDCTGQYLAERQAWRSRQRWVKRLMQGSRSIQAFYSKQTNSSATKPDYHKEWTAISKC